MLTTRMAMATMEQIIRVAMIDAEASIDSRLLPEI